jgi:hypothetical protein
VNEAPELRYEENPVIDDACTGSSRWLNSTTSIGRVRKKPAVKQSQTTFGQTTRQRRQRRRVRVTPYRSERVSLYLHQLLVSHTNTFHCPTRVPHQATNLLTSRRDVQPWKKTPSPITSLSCRKRCWHEDSDKQEMSAESHSLASNSSMSSQM